MERFTNDSNQLREQLRLELLGDWPAAFEALIFTYLELPHFLDYGFSFHCSYHPATGTYRLMKKEWDAAFDWRRFDQGIYNIDRLAISCRTVDLSKDQEQKLTQLPLQEAGVFEIDLIILDGLLCELHRSEGEQVLRWNIDQEMNPTLAALVELIRSWERDFQSTILG